jgi:hypothetical protein
MSTSQALPRFHPVLRDGEGNAAVGPAGDVAVELGTRGVLEGVVVDPLRRYRGAMGRIDIQPVALGVLLQHGLHTVGQLVGMLIHVAGRHRIERLLVLERIAASPTWLVAGDRSGAATGPGRDGALLVARLLGPERGQVALEPGRFLGGDRGADTLAGRQRHRQQRKTRKLLQ